MPGSVRYRAGRRMHFVSLAFLMLAVFVSACTGGRVSEEDIRSAYKVEAGPFPVAVEYRTELDFPALEKILRMRVVFPDAPGNYPLIVFSHGNNCLQDFYAGFADHWASWGYVVIQPVHMDSRELGFSMKGVNMEIMNKVIGDRPRDVQLILDSLGQLETQVPGLAGKIDRDRMIMAGHSMGAGTTMSLTGVTMVSPRDGSLVTSDEDRFIAAILISEPSNNRIMPDRPWRYENVPTFIATGSEDFSSTGARDGRKSRNAYQIVEKEGGPPDQPHYYLYMEGSDHYLGGVICKEDVPGPKDYDGLKIINGSTMAFLDAYTADDPAARAFLNSGTVTALTDGRATLDLR